jgi:uncharacterized sporulation protein YeaH/YhbH (DUF444 family)
MSVVDRRKTKKSKTAGSSERLKRRYKAHIKKAVQKAVGRRNIKDIDKGGSEKVKISDKDMNEPYFGHGPGGKRSKVLPGNQKTYQTGDIIPRPEGGGGGSGGQGASDSGEGEDEFTFEISQEEFINYMFEDLELPNMLQKMLTSSDEFEYESAGTTKKGRPNQINIIRTLKTAIGRRIALKGGRETEIEEIKNQIAEIEALLEGDGDEKHHAMLEEYRKRLEDLENAKPPAWIDDTDILFDAVEANPVPISKCAMFCVMDVSGSMSDREKDLAKRFFILLYLFLKRNYQVIDVIFIRHHTQAKEVDEQEFFYSRETGGTIVSSSYRLIEEILSATPSRYSPKEWNLYGAQATDGDNWNDDSKLCEQIMVESLLPRFQHWAYIEIPHGQHQDLWHAFKRLELNAPHKVGVKRVDDYGDIWPVFRELFKKKGVDV